jgi:hypothetical protein
MSEHDDQDEQARQPETNAEFYWDDGRVAQQNYEELGKILATSGDLFRSPQHGNGLIQLLPNGKHATISKGAELLPVIVDRLKVLVMKDGKIKGSRISAADLNAMLKSETFLGQFMPVDRVTSVPVYLSDFTLTAQGMNDGGPGHRILYTGERPAVSESMESIESFLNVMQFETNADRTNAVAAALTVMLYNHWPGGKPIILATATKSHAGKDTVILFASGVHKSVSISYQTDWAIERSFVGAVKTTPDAVVVVVENARMGKEKVIASAFIERLATDPEPLLFSTGTGVPIRDRNDFVLAISTNFGSVSEDILNRAISIHLNPVGDIADRNSPIGNPKLEFLPANRGKIAAELRGMIERWKKAGQPLDESVRHPFGPWAKVVGGILKANGFTDFLANYGSRKTADDPVRRALGVLGEQHPNEWLGVSDWAKFVVDLGLEKSVIPAADQGTEAGRRRGIGVVLSSHRDESFVVPTDSGSLTLRLQKERRRWGTGEPQTKYQFKLLEQTEVAS